MVLTKNDEDPGNYDQGWSPYQHYLDQSAQDNSL